MARPHGHQASNMNRQRQLLPDADTMARLFYCNFLRKHLGHAFKKEDSTRFALLGSMPKLHSFTTAGMLIRRSWNGYTYSAENENVGIDVPLLRVHFESVQTGLTSS